MDELAKIEIPVLYDFWAAWCGPCRALEPIMEAIKMKYEGRLEVRKINIDDHPKMAEAYGIKSIPTLILVGESEKMRIVGGRPQASIEEEIEKHL